MNLSSGWVVTLTVIGMLAFIVSPITPPLGISMMIIGIIIAGVIIMKYYILKDNEKGKE